MKRATLINLHLILAAILLPGIAMYSITGGFYTWGVKGGYDSATYNIPIAKPLAGDLGSLIVYAQSEMDKQNQAYPSGTASLKSNTHEHILQWTGSRLDIQLSTEKGSNLAKLDIKQTSLYRQLVQLHKAKGGIPFKIYAAFIAISLLTILISGVLIGLAAPKYRLTTQISLVLGTAIWLGMIYLS